MRILANANLSQNQKSHQAKTPCNSMVYCSRQYGRLAIKNLTLWLHKVDPNFLAGICGAIPILRLQALKKRNAIKCLHSGNFLRYVYNFSAGSSKLDDFRKSSLFSDFFSKNAKSSLKLSNFELQKSYIPQKITTTYVSI